MPSARTTLGLVGGSGLAILALAVSQGAMRPPPGNPPPQWTAWYDAAINTDPQSPDYFDPVTPTLASDYNVCPAGVNEHGLVLPDEIYDDYQYAQIPYDGSCSNCSDCISIWPSANPDGSGQAAFPLTKKPNVFFDIIDGVLSAQLRMSPDGNGNKRYGTEWRPVLGVEGDATGFTIKIRQDAIPIGRMKGNSLNPIIGYVSLGDVVYVPEP